MSPSPFVSVVSTALVLPADDLDTDQIIPARFLKGTVKQGLGAHLFEDWRARPDFPLAKEGAKASRILLAGSNFGCGSSREHAAWALVDWGFRAVIARSFGDIFRQNATRNGLLPVALDEEAHAAVAKAVRVDPTTEIEIDLLLERVTLPNGGGSFTFPIDPFAKHCLMNGIDELGYILGFSKQIEEYERRAAR
jgi:3-isopropylmalate/(R)-2-methylmalate dehydratase small subunit